MSKQRHIAFTGYASVGKDTAAEPLIAAGYHRLAIGDIIKDLFDPMVQQYLGFSAHTKDRAQKALIRGLLVHGGEAFYDEVFKRYFSSPLFTQPRLPLVVNTRLMRLHEAKQWRRHGGLIIELVRPGVQPCEPCEGLWLEEIREAGYIDHRVVNGGTERMLHKAVCVLAGIPIPPEEPAKEK